MISHFDGNTVSGELNTEQRNPNNPNCLPVQPQALGFPVLGAMLLVSLGNERFQSFYRRIALLDWDRHIDSTLLMPQAECLLPQSGEIDI